MTVLKNPKYIIFQLLAFSALMLLSGCILGSFQRLRNIDIDCRVVSAKSGLPIQNAKVIVYYNGANSTSPKLSSQEFFTDGNGVCRILVASRTLHISGSDAFVGGYVRGIQIRALGYADGGLHEGLSSDVLSEIRERTFKLNQK